MKTTLKLTSMSKLLSVVLVLLFFGCKDGDDPDPRQAYLGSYEMDDHEVTIITPSNDSTITISNKSEIEFEMDSDLDADELKVELEDFIEEVLKNSLEGLSTSTYSVSTDFDDDVIVEISGNEFDLDDHDFDLTVSSGGSPTVYPTSISGSGELDGDEIIFEFEIAISVSGSSLIFEGSVEGEKD